MTSTIVQGIVMPFAQAFAYALVPVLFALALALLRKHNVDTVWFEAIGRAGGEAYKSLAASGKPISDRTAMVAAAQAGADYLSARVPGIVAAKALSPDALAQIAGAELGKLLGLDPATSIGGSTVSAVAGPGQTATAVVETAQ